MSHKYSKYQFDIYNAVKKTRLNISVEATAGSGKTTTILACLPLIPKTQQTLFASFSNTIVDELKSKVPSHIEATTLHKCGFKYIRDEYPKRKFEITADKYLRLAISALKEKREIGKFAMLQKKDYRSCILIQDVCTYARMTLTPIDDQEVLMDMCMHFNIEFDKEIIEIAMKLLKNALKVYDKVFIIDFADMIYFPAMMPEMINKKYDNIFLDEAQDTNKAQLQMIENMLEKDGRLIAVGDSYQSIYGFSGADVEAFKRIQERPDTMVLPLSICYRCSKKVVAKAKEVCSNIEAWEDAEEGYEGPGSLEDIREGDMVLSRLTAPLIDLYFFLLEKSVKARVIGKDIEKGLVNLAEDVESETFEGMIYNIELKFSKLEEDLKKLGVRIPSEHKSWNNFAEKVQAIKLLMKKVSKPVELVPLIHEIFSEDKKAARLMTIHRSKGLENERVFVIEEFDGKKLMPSSWAKQKWEHIQENNLIFVARTRSKRDLFFINMNES